MQRRISSRAGRVFRIIERMAQRGERRCAWCGTLLGYWDGVGTSHGICEECYDRLREEKKC